MDFLSLNHCDKIWPQPHTLGHLALILYDYLLTNCNSNVSNPIIKCTLPVIN